MPTRTRKLRQQLKELRATCIWLSGVSAEQYIAAEEATDRLLTRARRWPHWHERERRIAAILETHPTYKRGAPTILLLFKAYRLAGQGLSWQAGRR